MEIVLLDLLQVGAQRLRLEASLPDCRSRLVAAMDWLQSQLAGRDFLLGSSFSVADAACFHPLWFLRNSPKAFAVVSERPALARWFERVDAMGHGDVSPLAPDEALAIARHSLPLTPEGTQGVDPITGRFLGRVSWDLDGQGDLHDQQVFGSLQDIDGDDVVLDLYEASAEFDRPFGAPLRARVGRQLDTTTPEPAHIDGLRLESEPIGDAKVVWGAYGGVPVRSS